MKETVGGSKVAKRRPAPPPTKQRVKARVKSAVMKTRVAKIRMGQ